MNKLKFGVTSAGPLLAFNINCKVNGKDAASLQTSYEQSMNASPRGNRGYNFVGAMKPTVYIEFKLMLDKAMARYKMDKAQQAYNDIMNR